MSTPNLPEDTTTVLTAIQRFYPKTAAHAGFALGWLFVAGGVVIGVGHVMQHPFDGDAWRGLGIAAGAFGVMWNVPHPKAQNLLKNTISAMPHATAQPGAGLVVEKVK